MGLVLTALELRDFRNHEALSLSRLAKSVVIAGPNAVGKSSLLEAIQLISMIESFRTSNWSDLVRNGSASGYVKGLFKDGDRRQEVVLTVGENKRDYLFNGKRRRLSDMSKAVPTVLFTPDDLLIVKGPAEQRRSLVDSFGKRLSRQYLAIHTDYMKALRQRNAILKERQKAGSPAEIIGREEAAWEERLAGLGALMTVQRTRLYHRLSDMASKRYRQLSHGEELGSSYRPSYLGQAEEAAGLDEEQVAARLLQAIALRRPEEYARGVSLVGPHRDEIDFYVEGQEARGFASQGQQRSIALALKMAEIDLIKELLGSSAILLLDDVLSELDEGRRGQLLEICQDAAQSFITTTDVSAIPRGLSDGQTLVVLEGQRCSG